METFSLSNLNIFAVLVAALVYYFLGALWYSPVLFGKTWAKLQNYDMNDPNLKKGMWKLMLFTFINTLITAFVMALYGGAMDSNSVVSGLCLGASTAVGFMATSITTTFLYEKKPTQLFLIDIGYHFVGFLLAGVILSLRR